MERYYTKIVGTPVYADSPRPLTTVKDVIMDPEQGKLLAFVVNQNKKLVILPMDILSWEEVIRIHNHDVIINAHEVLRIEEVQKMNTPIMSSRVETKSGEYLGKVYDLTIDNNTFMLQKIFVAKGLLGLFRYDSRIISAKNIIEILPNKIVVKEDMRKIKEVEAKPEIALEDMAVT